MFFCFWLFFRCFRDWVRRFLDMLTFLPLLGNLTLSHNNRIDFGFGRVYLRICSGWWWLGLLLYSTTLQFFFSYSNGVECNGLLEIFFPSYTNF